MKKFGIISLAMLLGTVSAAKALGADFYNSTSLNEVVITATRVKEKKQNVTPFVEVINSLELKDDVGKNVGDVMPEAALGHVHKYPGMLTARVEIRGLATNLFDMEKSRVLVLVDGHLAGTVNLAKLPLDDVERIEIVKGPASVIYGSQAMGGVINIITKTPKRPGVHGSAGIEVGSWDYKKGKAELMGKLSNWKFYLLGSRYSQGDYKAKDWGTIKNTSYKAEEFAGKLGYGPLTFSYQYSKGWDIGSFGGTYTFDPNDYSNKKIETYSLNFNPSFIKFQAFYVKSNDEWHKLDDTTGATTNISYKETKTMGVSLIKPINIKLLQLISGFDWNRIKVNSHRLSGAPYFPNSQYDTYGVFTEARIKLFKNKVITAAGVRYDHFVDKIEQTPGLVLNPREETLNHVTVRGGLNVKLTENLRFKTNWGTGFRAPAPDELAANYTSSWGTKYIGNPDLKPEKSVGWDAGFVYNTPATSLSVDYFITNFKDKIVCIWDSTLSAMTYKNVSGAKIQGLELNLSTDVGGLLKLPISIEPFLNLTYYTQMKNEDPTEIAKYGETLLYTPKYTASYGVMAMSDKWSVRLVGINVGKEKVIDWNWSSPTYGKVVDKDSFTVYNLAASLTIMKHVELDAKIENLFNKAYEYVQYFPMPERTYYVGISAKF